MAEQVFVITGASSGIGLSTARMAARHGAAVMLVARDGEALAHVVDEIRAKGGRAAFHAADGARREELEAASARLFEALERGVLKADVGQTFPLAEVRTAHEALKGRRTTGATLLTP